MCVAHKLRQLSTKLHNLNLVLKEIQIALFLFSVKVLQKDVHKLKLKGHCCYGWYFSIQEKLQQKFFSANKNWLVHTFAILRTYSYPNEEAVHYAQDFVFQKHQKSDFPVFRLVESHYEKLPFLTDVDYSEAPLEK